MKICYFGIFDPDYARNRIIINGFKENKYEVILCRVDPRIYRGLSKFIELFREFRKLKERNFDYVIVGFPGHPVVWMARILFGRKIIFDAFVSLFNSNVYDRNLYSRFSFLAMKDWLLDFYSCHLSYKILLDTRSHISFFVNKFHINISKFIMVPISADERIFFPRHEKKHIDIFTVSFHGSYIPLQGINFIVESAILLKNEKIKFRFIGGEKMHKYILDKIRTHSLYNIELLEKVEFYNVPRELSKADICLGIFGITDKAFRVIPNKVYEGVAMGMPVITMDSPAIREVFTDKINIVLCRSGDGADLARAIQELKNNRILMNEIAKNARDLFESQLTSKMIVHNLLNRLK